MGRRTGVFSWLIEDNVAQNAGAVYPSHGAVGVNRVIPEDFR
jgi:hypothetical protein